ncbi:uncharacterized protein LOC120657261 [Panicum virgatum]|uniref:uncharacterized protein LOC120657261 n=1 Tax=Panicum virgatum TaxID=38727 RepID=UPI0019D59CDA|nr:uncharacterized protein LOC120657261 [Panicum virgatum]
MLLLPRNPVLTAPALPSSPSPSLSPSRLRPSPAPTHATSASPAASAGAFSVEDYLVSRCNLYPNVAARVAPELSAIRSPSKPDAVLAFLASALEFSTPLIACSVLRTLAPRADELRALGFTTFQMGLLVARCGAAVFRSRELISTVQFWLPYLRGRVDKLVAALKGNPGLLSADLRTVRSTIALLLEEGTLSDDDVGWFAISYCSKLLIASPEEVDDVLARADEFGVPRKTRAFKDAIIAAFSAKPERLAWKAAFFRDELGWTEAQVKTAAAKMPTLLTVSAERLRRNWEFLTTEVGMDAERVANFPALLRYDLEGRLVPRFQVMRVLQARRLWRGRDFNNIAAITEEDFVAKFIRPFLVKVPNLAKVYEAAIVKKEAQ